MHRLFRNVLYRRVQRKAVAGGDGLQLLEDPGILVSSQGSDGPRADGKPRVRDDFLQVDQQHFAQAAAFGASSFGRVERKGVRFGQRKRLAGLGAHQVAGIVPQLSRIGILDHHRPFAVVQGRANGFHQAGRIGLGGSQAVDDDLDVVRLVTVDAHPGSQIGRLAVDAGLEKTGLEDALEEFPVVSLARADHGREDAQPPGGIVACDELADLLVGMADHRLSAYGRESHRCPGVEQAQEVVYFGDGAYGGARIARSSLLFDGDHGRKAFDLVHIGAFHPADELAGIGGKGLHVAALPFGVDRIESQGGFPAAGKTGKDHQTVAGNAQVDVFQVVFAGAVYVYRLFVFHAGKPPFGGGNCKRQRYEILAGFEIRPGRTPREKLSGSGLWKGMGRCYFVLKVLGGWTFDEKKKILLSRNVRLFHKSGKEKE